MKAPSGRSSGSAGSAWTCSPTGGCAAIPAPPAPASHGSSPREPVVEAAAPTILVAMTVAPDPLPRQVPDTLDPRLCRAASAAAHGGPQLTDILHHRDAGRVRRPHAERPARH